MTVTEIPLTADNQYFRIAIAGTTYQMRIIWREKYWILDLLDVQGASIVSGIPLVAGADLLAQYSYLDLGFKLTVLCDDTAYPTKTNLGSGSHLLVWTE